MVVRHFHPHCLIDCCRPLIYIGRLLLIHPYYITKENRLQTSKLSEWIILVVSVLSVIVFNTIQIIRHNPAESMKNPFVMLSLVRYIYLLFEWLTYIIKNKINYKHIVKIFKRYQNLEKFFGLTETELKRIRNFSALITTIFITILSSGLLIFYRIRNTHWWVFLSALSRCGHILLFGLTDLTIAFTFGLASIFATVAHKKLRDQGILEKWKPVVSERKFHSSHTTSVLELRLAYRELLDIKEYINNTFSFQILATVTNAFIESVFFTFLNIIALQYGVEYYIKPDLWTLMVYAYSVLTKFLALVAVCHRLKSNLMTTGRVVHDVFSAPKDPETREELHTFASELLHRDPHVTAFGFFNVDFSLLYCLLGSIFMYIIILFQFKFKDRYGKLTALEGLIYFIEYDRQQLNASISDLEDAN